MSVWEAGRVWRDAPHKGATLNVLLSAAHESSDDGVCFLKVKTLARDARVTERAAQAALRKLEACGDLTLTAKSSGPGIASRYQLGVKFLHPSNQKGVNVVRTMGERSSPIPLKRDKTYEKTPLPPFYKGGGNGNNLIKPKPPEPAAACTHCEGKGFLHIKQRPGWTIYCNCQAGDALRAAEGKPIVAPGPLLPARRRMRGPA